MLAMCARTAPLPEVTRRLVRAANRRRTDAFGIPTKLNFKGFMKPLEKFGSGRLLQSCYVAYPRATPRRDFPIAAPGQ